MGNNFEIPEEERHRFAQPLGNLISGTRKETLQEVEKISKEYLKLNYSLNFYIVGDIVTKDFLASDFLKSYIRLCIIDEMTQRNKVLIDIKGFFEEIIESINPKGKIQKENFLLIENIITSKKRTLLRITEGEEDLLVIPLVAALSLEEQVKNIVFYGQPPVTDSKNPIPEGIVLVDVNKKIQKICKNLIQFMK
jgi:uncharacterized protein (UPF0218 family)